ncbi:YebC/PmpR family DNA-binding transcriptional regulator [Helicobacter bizzozeronii]|uniref:YebC/PmpR family DNA-binding transcriptional regulator n=1 Tax=Helicobacter bizzozeronii TaxID=56877 RepID=UPI000CEDCAC8|nr:YebC/PmpR family DNA-binding transcriptional regulator [Helicobacter bizzozeronii]
MGRAFEYRRAAKEKRWDKMSKVFPKLAKAITLAAKEGGGDPASNAKLRTAILNAKAQNMPKDNIEAAIKRASSKEGQLVEVNYEGKANHGVLLFMECMTDNPTRTIANLKSYFNKTPGASMVPNGSLEFMFARKSVFEGLLANLPLSLEDMELALIDYGLESLEVIDQSFLVLGDYQHFKQLQEGFESLQIPIQKACLQRIPTSPISLSEQALAEIEKLLDRIEEDEDVIALYSNIEGVQAT